MDEKMISLATHNQMVCAAFIFGIVIGIAAGFGLRGLI